MAMSWRNNAHSSGVAVTFGAAEPDAAPDGAPLVAAWGEPVPAPEPVVVSAGGVVAAPLVAAPDCPPPPVVAPADDPAAAGEPPAVVVDVAPPWSEEAAPASDPGVVRRG